MAKTNEVLISQRVAKGVNFTTWNIPRIKCGDKWRNIKNGQLVRKDHAIIGHAYKNAIMDVKQIIEKRGWATELTEQKHWCHEQLYYRYYHLRCWRQK